MPNKLEIELVPATAWGDNLRSRYKPSDWDRLRKACYANAAHKCEICAGVGARHPVEAHEVWDYNQVTRVQTLVRLIALCPRCHEVKHFGRAVTVGNVGRAFEHLRTVNEWTPQQAQAHIESAFALWRERSKFAWTLDISAVR